MAAIPRSWRSTCSRPRIDSEDLTPDAVWDRNWAIELLNGALNDLRDQYERKNRGDVFEHLKGHLAWNESETSLSETAETLGMTPVAVRVAVHRLRKQFQARLLERISEIVDSDEEVEEEVNQLMGAFRR